MARFLPALALPLLLAAPALCGEPSRAAAPAAGRAAVVRAAVTDLGGEDVDARERAVATLSRAPAAEIEDLVTPLLRARDEGVRRAALQVVRATVMRSAVPDVVKLLRHDARVAVRREACHALADLDAERAVEELGNAARQDVDVPVRRAAVMDLGRLGSADAADVLIGLLRDQLEDGDDYMKGVTRNALVLATGKTLDAKNLEGWTHVVAEMRRRAETGDSLPPESDEPGE